MTPSKICKLLNSNTTKLVLVKDFQYNDAEVLRKRSFSGFVFCKDLEDICYPITDLEWNRFIKEERDLKI